jgi:hypothetical protein
MFGLLMIHTFLVLASKGFHYDFATPAGAALLQLGLTLVALPFVTGFAVISGYESAFIRLGFANRSQRPPLAVRIGFISVTRWRLKYIRAATKGGTYNIARATTFRQARKATLDWRFARDEEDRAKTPAHGP